MCTHTTSTRAIATTGRHSPGEQHQYLEVEQTASRISTTRSRASTNDTTFLVDSRGTRFAIGPKDQVPTVLRALGYESVEPIATPRAWVELFASGPELSLAAAVQAADGAKQ